MDPISPAASPAASSTVAPRHAGAPYPRDLVVVITGASSGIGHATALAFAERGAPWWTDGAPDFNRCLARNTPYAQWYAQEGEGR